MIILHSCVSEDSREFLIKLLGALPDHDDFMDGKQTAGGHTIYCWDHGGRETYWAEGGTDKVSAFPSVVIDVPEYDIPETVWRDEVFPKRTVAAEKRVLRMPEDMTDIENFLDEINIDLTKSEIAGRPIPLLTRRDIDNGS